MNFQLDIFRKSGWEIITAPEPTISSGMYVYINFQVFTGQNTNLQRKYINNLRVYLRIAQRRSVKFRVAWQWVRCFLLLTLT